MKNQFLLLILCASAVSSLVSGGLSKDQKANIAKLKIRFKNAGVDLFGKLPTAPLQPSVRGYKGRRKSCGRIDLIQATTREILRMYGLNYLIEFLKLAEVQILPRREQKGRHRPDYCVLTVTKELKCKFFNLKYICVCQKVVKYIC